MFNLFVIGNIASGKSSATRYLERCGARRIDLDDLSKSLYAPGSSLLDEIAMAFGDDVLLADGSLSTSRLASRAFASEESAQTLNGIVYPHLMERLSSVLLFPACSVLSGPMLSLTVVEVSNAASFRDGLGLADEVMAISAPSELRRERALERGMSGADFDARAAVQPSDEELCMLADTVVPNQGSEEELFACLDAWLHGHGLLPRCKGACDGAA